MRPMQRLAMWLIAMGCVLIAAALGFPTVAGICGLVALGVLVVPHERKAR